MELLRRQFLHIGATAAALHVNMTFVPFPGNVPAVNALLGEHVTSVFADYGAVGEHLKVGKLRALPLPRGPGWSNCQTCRPLLNWATRT